jgi:polyisoprenoid-binding protein YceI
MKRTTIKRTAILSALTLSIYLSLAFTVRAEPRQYLLDPDKSKLYVQVYKDESTLAAALAHDHVVLATGWQGKVLVDPEKLAKCIVEVTVPVAGLRADLPEMRTLVGYKKMLSDSRQETVGKHMRAKKQLDAENFPQITFRSQSCSGTKKELLVNGELTIRGKSKAVTIPLQVFHSNNSMRAKGTFTVQHSDFGFAPYRAFFGVVKNRQDILFMINVVGTAQ